MLAGEVAHRDRPSNWSTIKHLDMNLSHCLAMDSQVRFIKGQHYCTLDIHFSPEMLECLALEMPELVLPFLNEYHQSRDVKLFREEVPPSQAILASVYSILEEVSTPGYSLEWLDRSVEVLLRQIFLWSGALDQRRGLTPAQLTLEHRINGVAHVLRTERQAFRSVNHCAQLGCMNVTDFKRNFKDIIGLSIFNYFQIQQLQTGRYLLLNTNMKVEEIAMELGYSAASFIKAFRKTFVLTPLAYRKRMNAFPIDCTGSIIRGDV